MRHDEPYEGDDHCGSEPGDRVRPRNNLSGGTEKEQNDARDYYAKIIDGIMEKIKKS